MASIAVLLALTGLYAVLNFAIRRRRREFGIRLTLGATRSKVFRSVILKGARQMMIGLLGGLLLAIPAALMLGRITTKSTLTIHPFDISVYCISTLVLAVVSVCAMSLPALNATQVDPIQALRNE